MEDEGLVVDVVWGHDRDVDLDARRGGAAEMLEQDRTAGRLVGQAAWRLGVSVREYRELEAGARSPSFETWDRICKLFGWAQTFVGGRRNA